MLKELYVQNYALIDELRVSFPGQMTVITGETGAGKSILIGALGLILGKRADPSALNDRSRKCIVEAVFKIDSYALNDFFKSNDLDYEDEATLRREVSAEGKSRAFINDTPVSVQVLKILGEMLIDIHSQHETLMLNEKGFRYDVVDAFAQTVPDLNEYRKVFQQLKSKEKKLTDLQSRIAQEKKEQDYFLFQLNELEEAQLDSLDLLTLESQAMSFENAELIKGSLMSVANVLGEGENNLLNKITALKNVLGQIKRFGEDYSSMETRMQSVYIELKELEHDLLSAAEKVEDDPSRLKELNEKIDRINRLLKKHGVGNIHELIQYKTEIASKIHSIEQLDADILKLEKEIRQDRILVSKKAQIISEKRKNKIPLLESKVQELLMKLNMPNARFKINCESIEEPTLNGCDEISFLFSANKGNDYRDLHRVASGGELSRLMLCLKSVIAQLTALPTILFDEIDTGVSGEVGARIGEMLENMSSQMQVIAITHLPQIASIGKHHLMVYKKDENHKTTSYIKELASEDRVHEIAKMLSTGKPTEISIKNAEELIYKR